MHWLSVFVPLEIAFWKVSIRLMDLSAALLAYLQSAINDRLTRQVKQALLRSLILAGSGIMLGFTLGFLRALFL